MKQETKRLSAINSANTFETVALEWHENSKGKWSDSHADNILHRIKTDLLPALGKRAIAEITSREVLETIRVIEKRGAFEVAKRTLRITGQIFRYAIATDRAENDPTNKLHEALKPVKHSHFASIEIEELPELVRKIKANDARLYAPPEEQF